MKQFGVLVVDDSAFMRKAIRQMLEADSQFYVVGIARNGVEALEKVQRLKPDLVTMDVEMPEMDGLKSLEMIMKTSPVPVVMISSHTGRGAKETLMALELGAVDFFVKENLIKNLAGSSQRQEFILRLKEILNGKLPSVSKIEKQEMIESKVDYNNTDLIFIGCSTGGPSALKTILPYFPEDFQIPIVVAQHMPPGFTKPLAERFDSMCQLKVRESQDGQVIEKGNIYIAPSGYQTQFIKTTEGSVVFKVDNNTNDHSLYKPSIDITLSSAAPIFKNRLLSVILTGMGVDGKIGCSVVKKYGGKVLVEAEDSCIVYGMPKAVLEAGYADGQYSLTSMYQEIISFI